MIAKFWFVLGFHSFEHVWVIARLPQLHQPVIILFLPEVASEKTADIEFVCKELGVDLGLERGQAHRYVNLVLGGQFCSPICLGPPKHEWLQDSVKDLNDEMLGVVVDLAFLIRLAEVEPFLEVVGARKDVWHHEIEQAPQFPNIVLQWRSRE